MSIFANLILTAAFLAAAAYAHYRLPYHTASAHHTLIARLFLIVVGIAFGVVMATTLTPPVQGWASVLPLLSGFGLVHVPAAAILFLKRQRAKG